MLNKSEGKYYLIFAIFTLLVIAAAAYWGSANIDILGFFGFVFMLGLIVFLDRKKVKFHGFVFMRRTERVNKFIDNTAKKYYRMWKFLSVAGVAVAIPALFIISAFLLLTAVDIAGGAQAGGAGIVLPGPVSSPQAAPGVFILPWWIWVIGVITVMIPHEFFHGIMFRIEKIRIKSVGWILFFILPGAFAEPDEKQLKRSKRSTKLKVYAAGSFSNLLVAFIIILILTGISATAPVAKPAGVFYQLVKDSPVDEQDIRGAIIEIDGIKTKTPEDVVSILKDKKAGDLVVVKTIMNSSVPRVVFSGKFNVVIPEPSVVAKFGEVKTYNVILAEHPDKNAGDKGFLGIANMIQISEVAHPFGLEIVNILIWMYVFSFGIGLINLLPIKPLDGGLIFEEVVGKFSSSTKIIVRSVSVFMLLVLLFNIFGVFIV